MDSLFDDSPPAPETPAAAPESDWQEVPQERFLSWAPAMQAAYCAARDAEAALGAETAEEAEWFIERSKRYKEMIHGTESGQ